MSTRLDVWFSAQVGKALQFDLMPCQLDASYKIVSHPLCEYVVALLCIAISKDLSKHF